MVGLFEQKYKRVDQFADSFSAKFQLFKEHIVQRYQINIEYITLIQEMKELMTEHQQSPVEFVRKDQFIICSDGFRTRAVSVGEMKKYVGKARLFIQEMNNIIDKHEHSFR